MKFISIKIHKENGAYGTPVKTVELKLPCLTLKLLIHFHPVL